MKRKKKSAWIDKNNIFDVKPIKKYHNLDVHFTTGTYRVKNIEVGEERVVIFIELTVQGMEIIDSECSCRVEIESEKKLQKILEKFEDIMEEDIEVTDLIGNVGLYIHQSGDVDCFDNLKEYLDFDYIEKSFPVSILQLFPVPPSFEGY